MYNLSENNRNSKPNGIFAIITELHQNQKVAVPLYPTTFETAVFRSILLCNSDRPKFLIHLMYDKRHSNSFNNPTLLFVVK